MASGVDMGRNSGKLERARLISERYTLLIAADNDTQVFQFTSHDASELRVMPLEAKRVGIWCCKNKVGRCKEATQPTFDGGIRIR